MNEKDRKSEIVRAKIGEFLTSLDKSVDSISNDLKLAEDLNLTEMDRAALANKLDEAFPTPFGVEFKIRLMLEMTTVGDVISKVIELIVKEEVRQRYQEVSDYLNEGKDITVIPNSRIDNDLGFSSERRKAMARPLSAILVDFGAASMTGTKAGSFSRVSDAQAFVWGEVK